MDTTDNVGSNVFFLNLESGADVQFNPRLDRLIERAKSISMPKQGVENAIKTGAGVRLYDFLILLYVDLSNCVEYTQFQSV